MSDALKPIYDFDRNEQLDSASENFWSEASSSDVESTNSDEDGVLV